MEASPIESQKIVREAVARGLQAQRKPTRWSGTMIGTYLVLMTGSIGCILIAFDNRQAIAEAREIAAQQEGESRVEPTSLWNLGDWARGVAPVVMAVSARLVSYYATILETLLVLPIAAWATARCEGKRILFGLLFALTLVGIVMNAVIGFIPIVFRR